MVRLQSRKKAYSLAELLMIIAIIGVIIVLMYTIVKPNNIVLKLQYYKVYNVLALAAYNLNETVVQENREFYQNIELCNKLKDYINVTDEYSCNSNYVDYKGSSFTPDKIQFIATNGTLFYLSEAFTLNGFDTPQTHRIVWVDLNGSRRPNTAVWKKGKAADIVAFSITDNGEVIPLGYPKVDLRYMQTKIVYADEQSRGGVYTFLKAQNLAFGGTPFQYEVLSYNFDQTDNRFKGGVLEIDSASIAANAASQQTDCVSEDDNFPQCSIEIVN